ncbi:copper homeostasis periplasmic binding protein CopC [Rhodoblastus acidophilus]|uniref:Copper homeostasis periplasmic binding protein CopC n=1 Tax=Candidatus Rhodoblastus alkanivorans TaxID=2954117 RepID=A0ABS9Z4U8_9HYPH|nr:copper homeostasis periplasmic binding protein CopC [Candidatus Rhodoblastus alkanivorans]MCI4677361.1 copper homeostasis periplasmic binding protein CopC [Candidatus Rhodoblastus alkanivorans]MCI4682096.1 copper homeostasis periplasmic binding protein CopC [Candidatus Rhodoblastus alkanivorans]MDI4639398.1 copper homeostasis periplasmic binding protein CopC [Rhodoblastus acidophilus]
MIARHQLRYLAPVLLYCALISGASAHAHLKSASPAPDSIVAAGPQEVRIAFSEAVEPSMSAIEIVGAKGPVATAGKAYVDQAAPATLVVKLSQPLPPGAYETRWRCVSNDTHVMRGSYHFEVRP